MVKSEIEKLKIEVAELVGQRVKRPSGTLMGHAAGLPFEDLVHNSLLDSYPKRAFRHFELLNELFLANPEKLNVEDRMSLLGPASLQHLLKRGKSAIQGWSKEKLFEEKQNDTAESIVLPTAKLAIEPDKTLPTLLIDVKTQDVNKKGQAPNIISAEKIATACKYAIEIDGFLPFDIVYIGIKWSASKDFLTCEDSCVVSLTQIPPEKLYINWAAALQIQFHPFEVNCDYKGSGIQWASDYLNSYCDQLENRIEKDREKLKRFRSVL